MIGAKWSDYAFNGAICKTYCWSQGHSDLEIRIFIDRNTNHDEIRVILSKTFIRVERSPVELRQETSSIVLMEGLLERDVRKDSLFWVIDKDLQCIVIYIDKQESLWWQRILRDEDLVEEGPRFYSVPMDNLNDSSRMAIDKLIVERRREIQAINAFKKSHSKTGQA